MKRGVGKKKKRMVKKHATCGLGCRDFVRLHKVLCERSLASLNRTLAVRRASGLLNPRHKSFKQDLSIGSLVCNLHFDLQGSAKLTSANMLKHLKMMDGIAETSPPRRPPRKLIAVTAPPACKRTTISNSGVFFGALCSLLS